MTLSISDILRAARARQRPVVCLLIPVSAAMEFRPVQRSRVLWLRNRARRAVNWMRFASGLGMDFHFTSYEDHHSTNRGDIAIRLASCELLREAFGTAIEIIEIGWDEVTGLDADAINAHADLFVIGGGGYYFLDRAGRLSQRIPRDLAVLRRLTCPVISLCPGVNRLLPDRKGDPITVDPLARAQFAELLHLMQLSSVRDELSRQVLDLVVPGRTVALADPALFLRPATPPPPRQADGILHVGLNIAFHDTRPNQEMPQRLRLVVEVAQAMARRWPCRFHYFVHSEAERLIPSLLRHLGVRVTVVDAPSSAMVTAYAGLDLHICQMLHSSILCLNAGVPAINLSYDVKNAGFLDMMGLHGFCLPGPETGRDELLAAVEQVLARRPSLVSTIAARKIALKRDMDAYLADAVGLVQARIAAA
jgi:polysaccharide pyruvyl transferase WcaK-like protein